MITFKAAYYAFKQSSKNKPIMLKIMFRNLTICYAIVKFSRFSYIYEGGILVIYIVEFTFIIAFI